MLKNLIGHVPDVFMPYFLRNQASVCPCHVLTACPCLCYIDCYPLKLMVEGVYVYIPLYMDRSMVSPLLRTVWLRIWEQEC